MRQQLSFLFAFSVFLCGKGRWELFRFLTNRGRTFGSSKVHRARQQESDPSPRWHVRCCDGRLRFFVLLYCVVASFDISHCRYCYVRSTRSTEKWPAAVVAFFLSSVLLTELTTDGRTDFLPQPLDRWNDDEGAAESAQADRILLCLPPPGPWWLSKEGYYHYYKLATGS